MDTFRSAAFEPWRHETVRSCTQMCVKEFIRVYIHSILQDIWEHFTGASQPLQVCENNAEIGYFKMYMLICVSKGLGDGASAPDTWLEFKHLHAFIYTATLLCIYKKQVHVFFISDGIRTHTVRNHHFIYHRTSEQGSNSPSAYMT